MRIAPALVFPALDKNMNKKIKNYFEIQKSFLNSLLLVDIISKIKYWKTSIVRKIKERWSKTHPYLRIRWRKFPSRWQSELFSLKTINKSSFVSHRTRTYVWNFNLMIMKWENKEKRHWSPVTGVYKDGVVFKDKNTWRRFLSTGIGRSLVESLKIEELQELVSVKANEMDEPPKAPSSPWEPSGPSPIEPPKSSSASSWVGIRASRSKLSLLFSLSALSAGRRKSGRMRSFLLSRPRWSWRSRCANGQRILNIGYYFRFIYAGLVNRQSLGFILGRLPIKIYFTVTQIEAKRIRIRSRKDINDWNYFQSRVTVPEVDPVHPKKADYQNRPWPCSSPATLRFQY